jgi:hypothetical protein
LGSLERYFNRKYYKNKKQEKQQQQLSFFYLGNYPKYSFLIFFKFGKLAGDYLLLLPSNPLDGNFFCLENIDC